MFSFLGRKVETLIEHGHAGLKLGEACKSVLGSIIIIIIIIIMEIRYLYIVHIFRLTSIMPLWVGHVND